MDDGNSRKVCLLAMTPSAKINGRTIVNKKTKTSWHTDGKRIWFFTSKRFKSRKEVPHEIIEQIEYAAQNSLRARLRNELGIL